MILRLPPRKLMAFLRLLLLSLQGLQLSPGNRHLENLAAKQYQLYLLLEDGASLQDQLGSWFVDWGHMILNSSQMLSSWKLECFQAELFITFLTCVPWP